MSFSNYFKILLISWSLSATSCLESSKKVEVSPSVAASDNERCLLSNLGLEETLGSPTNIDETLELINALPKPVSVACVMQALNRPIYVSATNSTRSAQPAQGSTSPRVFIVRGNLVLAFVLGNNDASYLIEFAELDSSYANSVKGELKFPVSNTLNYSAPYDRILLPSTSFGGVKTTCGSCHGTDYLADVGSDSIAYSSKAFKPRSETLIELSELFKEYQICGMNNSNDHRCELYSALFDQGDIHNYSFPAQMNTFF